MEQQTVVVQQAGPNVGPESTRITCPSCHETILTRIEHVPSTKTHIIAVILCIFGCCLCACCPYCIDSCRNANHYCPKCSSFIGTHAN